MFGFFQPVPWDFPFLPSGTQHIECHLCSSCIDNASACFLQTCGLSCNYHHTTEPSSPARLCTAISPTRALTLRGGFSISSLWTLMSHSQEGATTEQETRPDCVRRLSSRPPPTCFLAPSLLGSCLPLLLPAEGWGARMVHRLIVCPRSPHRRR